MGNKGNSYYLSKMENDLQFIMTHMGQVSYEEFVENEVLQDSMMFRLIQISENARKLSDDYIRAKSEIPWGI